MKNGFRSLMSECDVNTFEDNTILFLDIFYKLYREDSIFVYQNIYACNGTVYTAEHIRAQVECIYYHEIESIGKHEYDSNIDSRQVFFFTPTLTKRRSHSVSYP